MFSISHKTNKTQKNTRIISKRIIPKYSFFNSTLAQIFKFKQKKKQLNKINHLLLIYQ